MKKKDCFLWRSASAGRTQKIGFEIASLLKPCDVVAIRGDLGAGKTTLVKGIARGLGLASKEVVSSPTFVVIHEYQAQVKIYHMDWYRLERVQGVDAALAEECFEAGGIALVEWPERGKSILPKKHVKIDIRHKGSTSREIQLSFNGAGSPS